MEELLTGELPAYESDVASRAAAVLMQLETGEGDRQSFPDPAEMARTALQTLGLEEIEALKPYLVPELAIWATAEDGLVAGRADAVVIRQERIEVVIDWKSDVSVTPALRSAYARQLQRYLAATGAERGALVFMSLGEIAWVERAAIGDGGMTFHRTSVCTNGYASRLARAGAPKCATSCCTIARCTTRPV
jgi:CRISPR-associated exonuclease Cas4